jgi:hypothetical protein
MPQKMLICFTDISAEILLHILGYSFCTECHILAHFFAECSCHEKHRKLSAEILICFGAKNVGEIDPCMTYFHLAI